MRRTRTVVPLATQSGLVSSTLQSLAKGQHVRSKKLLTATPLSRIEPGQKTGPSSGALAVVIEICKQHSLGSDPVNIGGFNLRTVTADIRPAHIIDHDQDDVGLGGCLGLCGEKQTRRQNYHGTGKDEEYRLVFHGTGEGCRRSLMDSRYEFMKKPVGTMSVGLHNQFSLSRIITLS